MQVPEKYYDEIFDFKGQWDIPSRCGLKILASNSADKNKAAVIVTELYQDNPGTSVTAAGKSLAQQICVIKNMNLNEIVYIQCNPNTNSKLSFYDEDFFEVKLKEEEEPSYRKLSADEVKKLFS